MFVLFFLLSVVNVALESSHPLVMGMGLLVLTVMAVSLVVWYGSFYGFSLFMVMVGGVLVVFSYTISLVPYISEKKSKMSSEVSNFYDFLMVVLGLGFFCLVVIGLTMKENLSSFGLFSNMFYYTEDWSLATVWMSILLFLVMIFCVNVAGNYKGALCK
ncbi:NADH dehydrogenase subunit 6 (mitochondrion) [Mercenaria mercenaria]|uniref:NADH dehydrogenase subunit 6 n=1 Tax=Mercenaria mercenaria TaxID=6596 RepID=A0A6H0JQM3_MERMC|nr:NADH dehydrogenase subunit 6 [Mercenaria mercenaria]QIU83214.1 NADH dehydrogenase subunit 6 [Mercenaria mercenaria]